jgi:hypothetical protein
MPECDEADMLQDSPGSIPRRWLARSQAFYDELAVAGVANVVW